MRNIFAVIGPILIVLSGCGKSSLEYTSTITQNNQSIISPKPLKDRAIQYGTAITDDQYPAVVRVNGCSGTLIDSNWVISASHCLASSVGNPGGVSVTVGSLYRRLTEIRLPEGWQDKVYGTDIALGRLDSPITTIQPLPIFEGVIGTDTTTPIVGYGVSESGAQAKRQGVMKYLRADEPLINDLPSLLYLGAGEQKNAPCIGDSGGALIHKIKDQNMLAGVIVAVYYGQAGICGTVSQAVAVNLAAHAVWIYSVIGRNRPNYDQPKPNCELKLSAYTITTNNPDPTFYFVTNQVTGSQGSVAMPIHVLPKSEYTGTILRVGPGSYTFEATVINSTDGQRGTCQASLQVKYQQPSTNPNQYNPTPQPYVPPPPVTPTPPVAPPVTSPVINPPVPPPVTPTQKPDPPCVRPQASAGHDRTIRSGQVITIGTPPVPGVSYMWTATNGRTASAAQIRISPTSTTTYMVRAKNECGVSRDSVIITVKKK